MSPLPTNIIRLTPPAEAVEARLRDQLPSGNGWQGFVGQASGVNVDAATGRMLGRYWVLHPFVGTPHPDQNLDETTVDRDWLFQVNVVAGSSKDCAAAVSLVDAALYRHHLVIPGLVTGMLKPPDGFDPGPPREDKDYPAAPRFYVPLQYATTITAT